MYSYYKCYQVHRNFSSLSNISVVRGPKVDSLLDSYVILVLSYPFAVSFRINLCSWCVVLQVRDWYVDSFKDLRSFPEIQDAADERKFTDLINQVKMRHNDVMPTMAMGIQELKEDLGRKVGLNELPEIHSFLDRFYMSRIGIRMLIGIFSILVLMPYIACLLEAHLHQVILQLVRWFWSESQINCCFDIEHIYVLQYLNWYVEGPCRELVKQVYIGQGRSP